MSAATNLNTRIPFTHEEEEFSRAYVRLVASKAGVSIFEQKVEYGLDGIFKPVYRVTTLRPKKKSSVNSVRSASSGIAQAAGPYNTSDAFLEFQIKSTFNWELTDQYVKFQLHPDDYDRLVDRDGRIKRILLILFCLPKLSSDWLHVDEERLLVRKCCYFTYLDGAKTTNTSSVTVSLPRQNIFTPSALRNLLSLPDDGGNN